MDNEQKHSEACEEMEAQVNGNAEEQQETAEEQDEITVLNAKVAELEQQIENEKKEYMFLMAEFDNYRKRSLKEKSELIKNGGETAFKNLLPVIDDFERALDAMSNTEDCNDALKEGVDLIYNKFIKYLEHGGVKPMDTAQGADFDSDFHEAVTLFPAPSEELKGKIIDTVQKGYMINEKVLRHAKVVVGE